MRIAEAVDTPAPVRATGAGRRAPIVARLGRVVRVDPDALLARWWVAVGLYALAALYFQHHMLTHPGSMIAGNLVGLPTQYMWAMWWWPHAIAAGVNPFVTHALWGGAAYNLGALASSPLLALLCTPINLVLGWTRGPVVSYNLLNLAAPILSAVLARQLCLRLTRSPGAAFVGGWFYGFSVFGLCELQGRLSLVFTFLPVALCLLSLLRLEAAISRRRFVALSAVAVAAQFGISTEIAFTTACLSVVVVGVAACFAPAQTRRRLLGTVVPELLGAWGLAAVLCSPLLYYALTGPQVGSGPNSHLAVADLFSYVIPTPLVRLGQQRFALMASQFPPAAGFGDTGTYLGLPLLLGALAAAIAGWRIWGMRVLVISAVVACVWSLGPILYVSGSPTIGLPWNILASLREFGQVSPVRVGLYVELAAAIGFALWLAAPSRRRPLKWLVALVGIAFVFPNTNGLFPNGPAIYSENVDSPAFIKAGEYRSVLHPGETVLPIPFGLGGRSLLWQAQTRGYFRLAGGFAYRPVGLQQSIAVQQLSGELPLRRPAEHLRSYLLARHIGAVAVVDGEGGPWPRVLARLGLRARNVGGVAVYDVPAALAPVPDPPPRRRARRRR
ncbi:MAG TPA: hypothetical protein VFN48_08840 [Solirubrobacteraceae bacterium]|nr:hypothetical protein [Solirubrobacteraceae bacterium]